MRGIVSCCVLITILLMAAELHAHRKFGCDCPDIECAPGERCTLSRVPCSAPDDRDGDNCGLYPVCEERETKQRSEGVTLERRKREGEQDGVGYGMGGSVKFPGNGNGGGTNGANGMNGMGARGQNGNGVGGPNRMGGQNGMGNNGMGPGGQMGNIGMAPGGMRGSNRIVGQNITCNNGKEINLVGNRGIGVPNRTGGSTGMGNNKMGKNGLGGIGGPNRMEGSLGVGNNGMGYNGMGGPNRIGGQNAMGDNGMGNNGMAWPNRIGELGRGGGSNGMGPGNWRGNDNDNRGIDTNGKYRQGYRRANPSNQTYTYISSL
ncbi:N66 matrix protein [Drosophila guanche]|uniref:Blast:Bifunctional endo-1,4-beta-xylanase XylA n=2 Tax=Drosophila guanche TaxID=7266 RepID=A0A3B0KK40_DROGU|nr:N66 matrix protein [Drosophila guanche]SPP88950.1 blast:Bifunctional endo-1%2C4-beta-xylanase XylA [Drosophila guanche]